MTSSGKSLGGDLVPDELIDLPADGAEGFEVTPELEAELAAAMDEADHGELVPAAEVLARLRP